MAQKPSAVPNIAEQSPAVDFIDNRLGDFHPAFHASSSTTRYDASASQYVPLGDPRQLPPAVEAMMFWDRVFPEAVAQLKDKHPEPSAKKHSYDGHSYLIRDKANWSEVYDELQAAKTVYDGRGSVGRVKKGLRVFVDKVKLVRPATAVLPSSEYLSPVLGALQIIMDAAAQSTKVRDEMSSSLSDEGLEDAFSDIETFLAIFPGDLVIERKALGVVLSILKATEDAIGYYLDNILRRAGKAVFLRDDYQKALKESLAQIKSSSASLMHEAQTSNIKQVRDMWSEVRDYSKRLIENDRRMMANQEVVIQNQQEMRDAQKLSFADLQNHFNALFEEHRDYMGQIHQQQLTEKDKQIEALLVSGGFVGRTPSPRPHTGIYLPQRNLWILLGMERWTDTADMDFLARKAYLISADHRERAEQVVTTYSFKEFITVPSSSVLLVHGDFLDGVHHVSALSSVCWTLANALKGTEGFKALSFFCGCHVEPDHDRRTAGAQGMVRTLIAQLLQQHEFDTTRLHEHVDLDAVAAGDLQWLCYLFVWLACHVPRGTTLVCLVDGINFYEREEHMEAVLVVLDRLLQTTREARLPGVLKVLVTSPVPTRIVRHHAAFYDGLNTVSMASRPKMGWGASSQRMVRQLREATK